MKVSQKLGATLAAMAFVLVGGVGTASAQTPAPNPAGERIDEGFAGLTSLVTENLGVALFALAVVIIGLIMGVRWLKKGASVA